MRGVKNDKKNPILTIDLEKILKSFRMKQSQFIDLCILCGCDYTGNIKGLSTKGCYTQLEKLGSIENVVKDVERTIKNNPEGKKQKYTMPDEFDFKKARKLFSEPNVVSDKE